ncbi:MAG: DUF421 domain-containing protein [Chloroflexota bacterium]
MDWGQIFEFDPAALGTVALRTFLVYVALFLGIRLAGKRELGQMTPFDLVVILVISNAVQNAMVGPDTSLTAGLLAAFLLLLVNWIVNNTAIRWAWLGQHITGSPTLLVNDGQFIDVNLRREGIDRNEVMMALREHGVADVADVHMAVLEVDGSISVVQSGAEVTHTKRRVRGRKPRP